jgi:Protein of unknown function (DUF1353)
MKDSAKQLNNEPVEVRSSHLDPPILSFVGGRNWKLEADFWFPDNGRVITVPKGFLCDLSSVPRALGYAAVRVFGRWAWRKDQQAQ